MNQTFHIALSPAQRFTMLSFSHDKDAKVKDRIEGRRFRRWMAAFGLQGIAKQLRTVGKFDSTYAVNEDAYSMFTVTVENLETCLSIFARELPASFEDICGDLLDKMEDLKAGRTVSWPEAAAFDAAADQAGWAPKEQPEA